VEDSQRAPNLFQGQQTIYKYSKKHYATSFTASIYIFCNQLPLIAHPLAPTPPLYEASLANALTQVTGLMLLDAMPRSFLRAVDVLA
jgi:hypothetical protein